MCSWKVVGNESAPSGKEVGSRTVLYVTGPKRIKIGQIDQLADMVYKQHYVGAPGKVDTFDYFYI